MVKDGWPVIAEDFKQWVVEGNFVDGMPAWDKVGDCFCHCQQYGVAVLSAFGFNNVLFLRRVPETTGVMSIAFFSNSAVFDGGSV